MKKIKRKNNKFSIIDLNELTYLAINSEKIDEEVIEQILNIDEDKITSVNTILEEQGVDLEKDINIIDGEKTILNANQQIEILDENDQHKITVDSEMINDIVNSESIEDIKNENIILVETSDEDKELNDSLKSQQDFETEDNIKKKEFKKVKILILLLGIFFSCVLILLALFSSNIADLIDMIEQKIKGSLGFISGF